MDTPDALVIVVTLVLRESLVSVENLVILVTMDFQVLLATVDIVALVESQVIRAIVVL